MPNRSTYRIENGGQARRIYGAKQRVTREASTLVAQTTDGTTAQGEPQRHWFGDLRRGRMNIYGGLLRFIDHLHRRGIPMETALMIPMWLESYIREVWTGTPQADAVPVELLRTGEHRKSA